MPSFKVRVSKDYTVFSAGHFITYEGDKCESLHGHNYRVAASVEGPLTADSYVIDFGVLKKLLRAICDRLDHRTLLAQDNPLLIIVEDGSSICVQYREKRYMFPRDEVILLPIPNTTAERLAEWIGKELEVSLHSMGVGTLTMLEVEVEESFGQSAVCRRDYSGS